MLFVKFVTLKNSIILWVVIGPNFEKEINHRIQLIWAAFEKMCDIFSSEIPQCLITKECF